MDINRFLEQDVPECYYSIAVIQAAIDHYMLYEAWSGEIEEEDVRTHLLKDIPVAEKAVSNMNALMDKCFVPDPEDYATVKNEVFAFREELKSTALTVASYTDVFRLYEYLLNRCKPVDKATVKPLNNDAAARDILSAIFASNENAVINDNIKLAVSQLPLRMTKVRFFDILENALRKYIDTDSSSLERELYMIRSSAGIYSYESGRFPELDSAVEYFESIDFSAMDDSTFKAAEKKLVDTVALLTDLSEVLQAVEQIVNLLCIILITYPRVEDSFKNDIVGMRILTDEALEGFEKGISAEMSTEALNCLEAMEGKFEPLTDKLQRIQSKIASAYKDNLNLNEPDVIKELDMCERLMSASVFADLEEEKSSVLTEKNVLDKVNELKEELTGHFAADTKLMIRARMAAVLSQLPVFFDSRTEVMNYVRDSLEGCRDNYEKNVAVRLLLDTWGKGTDK